MTGSNATICVVDDDASIRESLTLLLTSVGYDVETYASAQEFLELEMLPKGPACILLDVRMPGLSGLDLQEELAPRSYVPPIIFITGHGDIPMSVQAMKKGAVDFLAKPFDDDDLIGAVKAALEKDAGVKGGALKREEVKKKLDSLTLREYEIMTYLITGMLNKQIAFDLGISERTVKAHRKQVFDKLEIHSIAELVRLTEKMNIKPADGAA